MVKRKIPEHLKRHYLRPILTFVYLALIVYGSLHPWKGWTWPNDEHWWQRIECQTRYFSTSDITVNILLYIPVGLSLYWVFRTWTPVRAAIGWSLLAGIALSGTMEFLQLFLPGRIASWRDFALNTLGTSIGIWMAWGTGPTTSWGQGIQQWRQREFTFGRYTDFGIFVLAVWALAQLSPFIPEFGNGAITKNATAFWQALTHPITLNLRELLAETFQFIGLGFIAHRLWRNPVPRHPGLIFGLFAGIILVCKIPIPHQHVGVESFAGLVLALLVLHLSTRYTPSVKAGLCILSLIAGYMLAHITPHQQVALSANAINWIPFRYQILGDARGLATLLNGLWPFMGIAFCTLLLPARTRTIAAVGGVTILLLTLSVEWWQQWDNTQKADISDVLLALAGWALAWAHPVIRRGPTS